MIKQKPQHIPENGFYYHYKHSEHDLTSYAYEVVGVGIATEENCPEDHQCMVIYRPLYTENSIYEAGKSYYHMRPLTMFLETVTVAGSPTPRFQKITDMETIEELLRIRNAMYGTL